MWWWIFGTMLFPIYDDPSVYRSWCVVHLLWSISCLSMVSSEIVSFALWASELWRYSLPRRSVSGRYILVELVFQLGLRLVRVRRTMRRWLSMVVWWHRALVLTSISNFFTVLVRDKYSGIFYGSNLRSLQCQHLVGSHIPLPSLPLGQLR